MALNEEIEMVLQAIEYAAIPPLHTLSAPAARDAFNTLRVPPKSPTQVKSVTDQSIDLPELSIPLRIYHPNVASNAALPALVWMHGGGWVLGDLDTADQVCRDLCHHSGCVVISVDYRLAPEAVFPAAYDDSFNATKWVYDNAESLSVNKQKITVGGDSAGGNLAACVAITAREQQLPLAAQVLIYPVTEANFENASYTQNNEGYFLTRPMMEWFWDQYVPNLADRNDIRVAPIYADLSQLPPAIVLTVENDPLRDEGIKYAEALREHNVVVNTIHIEDTIHGYFGMDIECGSDARINVATLLRNMLSQESARHHE